MFDCIVPFIPSCHSISRVVSILHEYDATPLLVHVNNLFKPTTQEVHEDLWKWTKAFRDKMGYALCVVNGDGKKEYFLHIDESLDIENELSDKNKRELGLLIKCYELCKLHDCKIIFYPEEFMIDSHLLVMIEAMGIKVKVMGQVDSSYCKIMNWVNEDCCLLHDAIVQFDLDSDTMPFEASEFKNQTETEANSDQRALNQLVLHLCDTVAGFKFDPAFHVMQHLPHVVDFDDQFYEEPTEQSYYSNCDEKSDDMGSEESEESELDE